MSPFGHSEIKCCQDFGEKKGGGEEQKEQGDECQN